MGSRTIKSLCLAVSLLACGGSSGSGPDGSARDGSVTDSSALDSSTIDVDAAPDAARDAGFDSGAGDRDAAALDSSALLDAAAPSPCGEGRPGPTNTGPGPGLTVMEGDLRITEAGTVLEDVEVRGAVQIRADNVTLRNFRVVGGLYGIQATYGATNIVLESGEISGSTSAGVYGGGFTARCLDIHDIGGDGFKTTDDVVVEWSWVHHLGTGDGAHADGNQTRGGSNITFRHNHCDMGVSVPPPYKSNACFMLQAPDGTTLENFVIEDNWLEGGSYTIYCTGETRVRRNRFGRDFRYGLYPRECTEWIDNVWDDDGSPAD